MEKNNKKPILYHGRLPMNRREMLASGAIPALTWLTTPTSLLSTFAAAGVAQAQELCKTGAVDKFPAFINVNCSGGWWACGNWIPLTEGRELLPSYGRNGLGSANNLVGMIVKDGHFKNKPPFFSGSGFMAGVQSGLVPNLASLALAKTNFVGMPLQSQNDTNTNKLSPISLLQKAGVGGTGILPFFGQQDSITGVNQTPAFSNPLKAPLLVNNYNSIVNALGVADRLSALNHAQKTKMFKASQALSAVQSRNLASLTGGSLLDRLLNLANVDNTKLIENPSGLDLDPRVNTAFSAVWGLNANTQPGDRDLVNAATVYNIINGNAGAGGMQVGGCDYHGSALGPTIAKDNEIGTLVGRILQSLHVMSKPGFIAVTTDGSVGAPPSDIPGTDPTADRGDSSAIYMMYYDPTDSVQAPDWQVGHMKADPNAEAADDTFLVGGNPEIATAAVIANFFAAANKMNSWTSVPELNRTFDSLQLKKIVKFNAA
ncbi:MAG: hypothetical protein JNL11_16290 [Bdellovibrionaceae bacterium]|nr:hypothetical protein [Pseudobdellovibrionaceae bacterium]